MAFAKLLVANRGEIACRILRGAQALGYETVAVYSEADADAPHVSFADEALCIGGVAAEESYLGVERILQACRQSGANAVHPGYGFLAENAGFAAACAEEDIVFVGPPASAIAAMGDKRMAKERMVAADVPCIPGYSGEAQDEQTLLAEAEAMGYPLLVKAAAGGGGRGMRRVGRRDQLEGALRAARREAESAFGDGRLLLERLLVGARHVEVQVFADGQGNTLHLGERDCSAQRRHQKVIEEAPSPAVDPALRQRMGAAAVAAARAIGYVGAGTVEFLLADDGSFYFLEMNTRLQVEHPVTELVCGVDLVELQLRVAAGEALPFAQDDVRLDGWAMEARLYAEDPSAGYLPQVGEVLALEFPREAGLRVDHGLCQGFLVGGHYDPLLAKVIAYGVDREEARRKLRRALSKTVALGITHNKRFLRAVLDDERFVAGETKTDTLDSWSAEHPALAPTDELDERGWVIASALWLHQQKQRSAVSDRGQRFSHHESWQRVELTTNDGQRAEVRLRRKGASGAGDGLQLRVDDGEPWLAEVVGETPPRVCMRLVAPADRGRLAEVVALAAMIGDDGCLHLELGDKILRVSERLATGEREGESESEGEHRAPTSGKVVAVSVTPGQHVEAGQVALTLEAMKMETPVVCGRSGVIQRVCVGQGEQVERGQLLVEVGDVRDE